MSLVDDVAALKAAAEAPVAESEAKLTVTPDEFAGLQKIVADLVSRVGELEAQAARSGYEALGSHVGQLLQDVTKLKETVFGA